MRFARETHFGAFPCGLRPNATAPHSPALRFGCTGPCCVPTESWNWGIHAQGHRCTVRTNVATGKKNKSRFPPSTTKAFGSHAALPIKPPFRGGPPPPEEETTEALIEFLRSPSSPWVLPRDCGAIDQHLRELAVHWPHIIKDSFILSYFRSLRIINKDVTEIDAGLLKFPNLEELILSANQISRIDSTNLPPTLKAELGLPRLELQQFQQLAEPHFQADDAGDAPDPGAAGEPALSAPRLSGLHHRQPPAALHPGRHDGDPGREAVLLGLGARTRAPEAPHENDCLCRQNPRRSLPGRFRRSRNRARSANHHLQLLCDVRVCQRGKDPGEGIGQGGVVPAHALGFAEDEKLPGADEADQQLATPVSGANTHCTLRKPWAETIKCEYKKEHVTRDLIALKAYLLTGTNVAIVEEKVGKGKVLLFGIVSWPIVVTPDESQNKKGKGKAEKKKAEKEKAEKEKAEKEKAGKGEKGKKEKGKAEKGKGKDAGKGGNKKKKKSPSPELRSDPPILKTLGSGHVNLDSILAGDSLVDVVCNFGVLITDLNARPPSVKEKDSKKGGKKDKKSKSGTEVAVGRKTPPPAKGKGKKKDSPEGERRTPTNQPVPLTVEFQMQHMKWGADSQILMKS
ncbi:leucine-rich repeat-containing protein 43 isoform X5 [Anolis carolinensis]|uniref:leucine-rich repeat-containing protein 43 isoform X5 n=1 Tax=Anolis carolinensis TaxID=28377 RepID=UPI002F2B2569